MPDTNTLKKTDDDLIASFHEAIKEGNIDKARELINNGIAPSAVSAKERECQGLSPLHVAVRHDQLESLEFLLSQGVDVDIEDNFGFRPVHDACLLGNTACLRELLKKNASVEGVRRAELCHITPLLYAAQHQHFDCVIMLKDRTPNAEKILWETVSRRGNSRLLDLGTNENDIQMDDLTKLTCQSVLSGNLSFLVYACREVGVPQECAEQALIVSAQHGRDAFTRFLIEQGLDANTKNDRGLTALHYAARYGHIELIEDLLRMGAAIDSQAEDKITPLHLAVRQCQSEAVAKLLDLGADRNLRGGEKNETPLHMAIKIGDMSTLQEVLRREPDFTLKNSEGKTPLQLSAPKDVKETLMRYFKN